MLAATTWRVREGDVEVWVSFGWSSIARATTVLREVDGPTLAQERAVRVSNVQTRLSGLR